MKEKNTKQKKKSAKGPIATLVILVGAAAAFLFSDGFGLGLGLGTGLGLNSSAQTAEADSEPTAEVTVEVTAEAPTAEAQRVIAEVVVSGEDYLYNNQKTDLDALVAELKKLDPTAEIIVKADDTATLNATTALKERLTAEGIGFAE